MKVRDATGPDEAFDAEAVRARSTAELRAAGLNAPPVHLPVSRDVYEGRCRPVGEVVDRLRALKLVLEVAFSSDPDQRMPEVGALLRQRGLLPSVATLERGMLAGNVLPDVISWRLDAMYALGWAVGLFGDLPLTAPPFGGAPSDFAAIGLDERAATSAQVRLRSRSELVSRLDVYYCAHNAVVSYRLGGGTRPWPASVDADAVIERRHALEWLFAGKDWDDIALDT